MPVLDFYKGKNILITGTTGFLAKIVLEKFLRVMPDIGKIYVLIRKKRGSSSIERFKKEVIGSPCFDRVRKERKDFDSFISEHLIAIEGDLLQEGLDLSPEDYKTVTENVHVIINSAASVDFNARLDVAIQINVKGTLRMLKLAQETKNLENFVHISTCYVNCEKKSGTFVEEKIYDISFDAEERINQLEKIPLDTVVNETQQLIAPFPNTYTFTKSMAERIIQKNKGSTFVTIVRPSIIGSSWNEPFPGWVDTISAAGALYFLGGIGLLHVVQGKYTNIGDQIPADYVSDAIIVAAAAYANSQDIHVVHSASSADNPITWKEASIIVKRYFLAHPVSQKVSRPQFNLVPTERELKIRQNLRRIPANIYLQTAKILNSQSMIKKAEFYKKIIGRAETVAESFKYFTMNEWIYSTERMKELSKYCSPAEQDVFNLDIGKIDWDRYLTYFSWGLQKYILKENREPIDEPKNMNVIQKVDKSYWTDLQFALKKGYQFSSRSNPEMKSLIMSSGRVQEAIRRLAVEKKVKNTNEEQMIKNLQVSGEHICDTMFATYSMPVIRFMAWSMNKILKSIYDKIVIDETALQKFREFNHKEHGPVVLMPTHRSYMDFLLVSYIFFNYGLKCPHIAAAEDFLSIHVLSRILRSSGAFFLRRKSADYPEELYRVILYEYIQRLLIDESWLEFFIEGTRSRVGKMLPPKSGILSIVANTYLDKKLNDVQIVPVTINYERVLEGESFPFELLGEAKVKESLLRIIRAGKILNKNFGRVYVEFADPISLKDYTKKFIVSHPEIKETPFESPIARKALVAELGQDVINIMQEKIVVMPTAIVASVILMHRKGVNEEELIKKVEWVASELFNRGIRVGTINERSPTIAVKSAITHLETLLKKKKDIFHPFVAAKSDYKNILMLSYYRNMLLHVFFNEALIACTLMAFGDDVAYREGISTGRLLEEALFLQSLVGKEVYQRQNINSDNFLKIVEFMASRGILSINNGLVKVESNTGELPMQYLCSLIWPFVESYWACAVFCFSLKSRKTSPTYEMFLQEVQWFSETMYEERLLESFEACSLDTLKNAFNQLKDLEVLKMKEGFSDFKNKNQNLVVLNTSEEKLTELESHIKKFMKYSYTTSVRSPIDRARKVNLFDYPMVSGKL